MTLATLLIPPSLDAKQALRLRRLGLAALTYALTLALVAIAWSFDVLPAQAALQIAAMYLAINLGLYATIRSGLNLRFADPSLTRVQILIAITVVMFIVYHLDNGRDMALAGCFIVYLFGAFRLSARNFRLITLYTLAAYALVVNLLMHLRPEAIVDIRREWMSWLLLAGFLPVFTLVGGQVNALRRKLHESDARFRSLTEMSSDFYWETDTEHRLTAHSALSAFPRRTPFGERRWEIPHLTPDEAGWRAHREMLDAHLPFRDFELSRADTGGTERHVAISGDPLFDGSGAFQGYRGVGTDITTRKRAEQALRASTHELRLFADNVPVMIASWDKDMHFRFASRDYSEFYGLSATDLIGRHLRDVMGEDVYREKEAHLLEAMRGYPVTFERIHRLRNGQSRYLEARLLPDIDDQGSVMGCFAVVTDITEHKLAEKRLQQVAHHDSLTGLPNRLLFDDRLQQAISIAKRDSRQFALLYLDLDKFKPVNDSLGHNAGDELLQQVAARIRQQVRESDTVARVGGDEFTVILHGTAKREEAEIVCGKITGALARPFRIGSAKQEVSIGISIGIALYPEDAQDSDTLVKAADAAMYSVKQACAA